jgi:geranylgeranyl reductase family protein
MAPPETFAEGFDAIVVGAGPAGAATALRLATRKRRVLLLDKAEFPRDKTCGDGLTRRSVELLAAMGLCDLLAAHPPIRGVRVVTTSGSPRDSRYKRLGPGRPDHGLVVRRRELDARLCRAAVEAGATLWERSEVRDVVVDGGRVTGVVVRRGERETVVRSTFVVAADGGNSRLAKKAGLAKMDPWSTGFAARGYFENIRDVGELFEFRVPLTEPSSRRTIPGYGWVFPLEEGRANIGVGFFPGQSRDLELNIRRMYEDFVADLRAKDARFRDMVPIGEMRGAPLSCGTDFSRCVGAGIMLVGDAAGLVDPFTGEGIDTALESGALAAEVIDEALASPDPARADMSTYPRILTQRYGDRFQVGKRFIRTHGFMWKLLTNTYEVRRPLFEGLRRAVVDYGVSEQRSAAALARETGPWALDAELLRDVQAVEDKLAALVPEGFPLLSRVAASLAEPVDRLLRPLLLVLTTRFGVCSAEARVAAATAIELASLGFLAQGDVLEDHAPRRRAAAVGRKARLNWCNMFAVMAADHLLVRSYSLAAQLGVSISRILSTHSAEVCALKIRALARGPAWEASLDEYLELVPAQTAMFYVSSSAIGAQLGGLGEEMREKLTAYGRDLGIAVRLMRDVHDLEVEDVELLDHPIARCLEARTGSLPLLLAQSGPDGDRLRAILASGEVGAAEVRTTLSLVRASDAPARTAVLARRAAMRAKDRLLALPATPPRAALERLTEFVVNRRRAVDAHRVSSE